MTWKKSTQVFQTMGVPPRIGSTVLATIGSMTNISDALRNSVTTNSHTTAFESESDREVISVGWMTILSRERKGLQTDSRGSQLVAKGVPNHSPRFIWEGSSGKDPHWRRRVKPATE